MPGHMWHSCRWDLLPVAELAYYLNFGCSYLITTVSFGVKYALSQEAAIETVEHTQTFLCKGR